MATKKTVIMDGNRAAAYVSYAFTEVAGIFPITPSSPMAEHVDEWAANGKKNLFGQSVQERGAKQIDFLQFQHGLRGKGGSEWI